MPGFIHIHPLLWLMLFIGYVTGSFAELLIILTIVSIHELGHLAMAFFFRWRINKVMLWPFGGVMETDEYYSRPNHEEFFVILFGPLQHLWIYAAVYLMKIWGVLPPQILDYALLYNTYLLMFNLLPVWPLDGGKLLFLFLSKYRPFKKAYQAVMIFSAYLIVLLLFLAVLYNWSTLHTIMLACFLLYEIRLEWKRKQFVFLRHLMARKINRRLFKNSKTIIVPPYITVSEAADQFYKGYYHILTIVADHHQKKPIGSVEENECLHTMFNHKKPFLQLKQLI